MLPFSRCVSKPRLSRSFCQVSQTLADQTAWNQAPAAVTTLANGVRVATRQTFGETTSIGAYVNAGVRDEKSEFNGAGHLIEKLALSGTAKRPRAKLESEVESLGATLDVSVGREQSSFKMNLLKSDLKQGMDVLSDVVTGIQVKNLAKEREGIMRQLDEVELPPRKVIYDRLHACAFRDTALGYPSVGPFDGIENLTEAHLQQYMAENFTGNNLVIAAAGPHSHEELVKLAEAGFGKVPKSVPRPGTTKPYFCGAELIYRNDEMGPVAYIAVGWESVPWRSPDAVTFMVMENILGRYDKTSGLVPGTISGNRVANNVANKMGVGCADKFEGFQKFYKDTGMFGFYIECDEVAVEHAVGELMMGCNIMAFSITDEEVARAKRELKTRLFSSPTSADAACDDLGRQMLAYGRHVPASEMILRIEAVDAADVKRCAYKYLSDGEISITALGPLHGLISYYELRRMTNMHRY